MESHLTSIRDAFAPIRREGLPFVLTALAITIAAGWLFAPLFWVGLIITGWCAYFFRDPPRAVPLDPAAAVSPADGRVSAVTLAVPPDELGLGPETRRRVSIFMSVFDCHVNRVPLAGTVTRVAYRPGKFLNAAFDKASEENERNGIVLETAHGPVAVVQIAGLIARRILCFVRGGEQLLAGQRLGLIRFGSRLDVYLPATASVAVAVGQTAIAGETVIARLGTSSPDLAVRID